MLIYIDEVPQKHKAQNLKINIEFINKIIIMHGQYEPTALVAGTCNLLRWGLLQNCQSSFLYTHIATFHVAEGNARRIPSSVRSAINWQPRRDLQQSINIDFKLACTAIQSAVQFQGRGTYFSDSPNARSNMSFSSSVGSSSLL